MEKEHTHCGTPECCGQCDTATDLDLETRVAKLEEWSHPPVAPGGTTELLELIHKLEKRIEALENGS